MLDIASKSGSFAQGYVKKLTTLGFKISDIRDSFVSIPTSGAAYEFTRKMYLALGLNPQNIAQHFTSFDLIKLNRDELAYLLNQDKKICDVKLTDLEHRATITANGKEGIRMKFAAVVGNPPYQEFTKDTSDSPIYHLFMDSAYTLADRVCLIHPARFLFNAGKTPKRWNKKILNDPHVKVVFFDRNSGDVFPGTDISGGIAITIRDATKAIGPIGTFSAYPEISSITKKVISSNGFKSIKEQIYLQNKFDLKTLYSDHPEYRRIIGSNGSEKRLTSSIFSQLPVFKDLQTDQQQIPILGLVKRKRTVKYIDSRYVDTSNTNLADYKVAISSADGAAGLIGSKAVRITGQPILLDKMTGITQTFISIGAFKTKLEGQNAVKYIQTRFARMMVGTLKATNGTKLEVWSNLPDQNFGEQSDIDWSQPVANIDEQLYKKYGLTDDETAFIKSKIEAME